MNTVEHVFIVVSQDRQIHKYARLVTKLRSELIDLILLQWSRYWDVSILRLARLWGLDRNLCRSYFCNRHRTSLPGDPQKEPEFTSFNSR